MPRPRLPALFAITACVLGSACLPGLAPPPLAPLRSGLRLEDRRAPPVIPAGPLRVAFAAPEGEAAEDAVVTFVFSKPMRALGAAPATAEEPAAPATILPATRGKWRWIGSSALLFEPAAPLPQATSFRVEIPAGTRALDGSQLEAARVVAFTTPRPAFTTSNPTNSARRVDPAKPITLWFNQRIADAEIARTVTITAGTSRAALPFAITRREGLGAHLAPRAPLPRDAEIHVRIDPSLRAEVGDLVADKAAAITFHTVGPLRVEEWSCTPHPLDAALCDPESGSIHVRFSNPVDADDVKRALKIEASKSLLIERTDSNGDGADIHVGASFLPATTYRLRLGPLVDERGQALGGEVTHALRFGDLHPETKVELTGTYWAPLSRHNVSIAGVNVTDLAVSAATLDRDDVLRRLAAPADGPAAAWHPLTTPPRNERAWSDVGIEDLLGKKGLRGPILLRATGAGPDASPRTDAREVQITDLALSTRASPDRVLVWMTRLSTGASLAGAAVELRRFGAIGSAPIASAITDVDGLASLPLGAAAEKNVAVIARSGDDWAYRAIRIPAAPTPMGMLFTERGIYRPGEIVSLEGIFRVPDARALATPRGRAVEVWVEDPSGKEIARSQQTLSTFGTFTTEIPIRRDAALGDYHVSAKLDGGTSYRSFTVHEYRPAESTATATVDRAEYIRGDAFTCAARGRYLYSGPMVGALASAAISRSSGYHAIPGLDDWFVGDDIDARATLPDLATGHGQLDAAGAWSLRTPLVNPGQMGPEQILCAIEIADKNRQTTAATSAALVHPGEVYVALHRPDDRDVEPGATITPELLTVTPSGERRSLPVHVELIRRIEAERAPPKDTHVAACDVITGPAPVSCKLETPRTKAVEGDHLILRATTKDARGNPLATALLFDRVAPRKPVVVEPPPPPPTPPAPRLSLSLSRHEYRVGETARLVISSPFTEPASARITAEREGILWQRVVPLQGSTTIVDVPIALEMIPNVELSVRAVSGKATQEDSTEITVDAAPHKLDVAVHVPTSRQAPGADLDVDVEVKDAHGKPAHAEVTLFAADEGSLQLTYYLTPDPLRALYAWRRSLVQGTDAREDLVRSTRYSHRTRPPEVRMGATSATRPRGDFKQTVIFAGHLVTDAAGHVRRRVKLPDGLTSYRFMAVAVSEEDAFGSDHANVITSKPLMLRPTLPRVIRAGDRFEASVVVSTLRLQATSVDVTATVEGFTAEAPAKRTVQLDQGGIAEVRFPLRADRAGPAKIAFSAITSDLVARDEVELKAVVVAPIALETAAVYGATTSAVAERLVDLGAMRDDTGGLTLTLAATPLAGLARGIEELLDYPHGCTEQTVSRMLPLLALRDLAVEVGVKLPADVPATIAAAAARLAANQRSDGGFGLWPESSASEPWITAWATWGLDEARRRGLDVPTSMLDRVHAYLLRRTDPSPATGLAAPEDRALAAFVVDVLAASGTLDAARADRLFAERAELPTFARALLLHALAVAGPADPRVATLTRDLEGRVQIDGPVARVLHEDSSAYARLLDSPVRTSALTLRALVAVRPDHPLASRLAAGLLAGRRAGSWRSTQETAWALLALDALRAAHPTASARFDARVFLGQGQLGEASFPGPLAPRTATLTVPTARLRAAGEAPLTFAVVGKGELTYEARVTFARRELPTAPVDAGFFVQRSLRALAGAGEAPASGAEARAGATLTAGDLVLGEIEIVNAAPRDFVVIEDPLPGGLEAVDLDLGLGGAWLRRVDPGRFTRRELGDGRVTYFIDHLPAGVTRLRYLARATTIGRFVRPPLHVEEMYAPEVFGQTAADVVTVDTAP